MAIAIKLMNKRVTGSAARGVLFRGRRSGDLTSELCRKIVHPIHSDTPLGGCRETGVPRTAQIMFPAGSDFQPI